MADFPILPKPFRVTITSIAQTNASVAHSLRLIVSDRGGHRWSFALDYPGGMTRSEFSALWAFVVSQRGRYGSFDFVLPEHVAQGSMAGAPVVHGAAQTGRALATRGWTNSAQGVLKAGDFIRIAGSYKAHMVTADVDADAAGYATILMEPAMEEGGSDGVAITSDGTFRCALADDLQPVDVNASLHYGFSVNLIEVLS